LDFKKHYDNNLYKVYRNFTIVLLKLILGKKPKELITLLADDYFTPDNIDMECTIKKFTNDHYKNFVITGVCQIDSRSSDILQLTDLILGAIVYDLKKQEGLIKKQAMTHNGRRLFLSGIMNNNTYIYHSILFLKVKDVDKFINFLAQIS